MQLTNDYNLQEISLHKAAQLISLTGVSTLKHLPDDSHTTMEWNERVGLLHGRGFEINAKKYYLGIKLLPFELELLDSEMNPLQLISIDSIDQPALYGIWEEWLRKLGFQGGLVKEVHYELPKTPEYSSILFQELDKEFAKAWTNLRSLGNKAMQALNKHSGLESEINIWPHHFDTGVYYPMASFNEEVTQSIGAGLAIADTMINEPYFYIYGWAKEGVIDYHEVPKISGQWLIDGWQGAVLKASEITSEDQVNKFFEQAFDFLKEELDKHN